MNKRQRKKQLKKLLAKIEYATELLTPWWFRLGEYRREKEDWICDDLIQTTEGREI